MNSERLGLSAIIALRFLLSSPAPPKYDDWAKGEEIQWLVAGRHRLGSGCHHKHPLAEAEADELGWPPSDSSRPPGDTGDISRLPSALCGSVAASGVLTLFLGF